MYYNIGVAPNAKSDLNMQSRSMKTNEIACQKGLQISKTNYLVPTVLALVIILTASIRYRLIDVPLDKFTVCYGSADFYTNAGIV